MINRLLRSFVLVTVVSLPTAGTFAGDFAEENGVALRRFDPVSYFVRDRQPMLGVRELSTTYKGSKFHFAPQYGGFERAAKAWPSAAQP